MADFYEDKQLTMKQFLVVLAIGFVLDAIPDLLEVGRVSYIEVYDTSGVGRGRGFTMSHRSKSLCVLDIQSDLHESSGVLPLPLPESLYDGRDRSWPSLTL